MSNISESDANAPSEQPSEQPQTDETQDVDVASSVGAGTEEKTHEEVQHGTDKDTKEPEVDTAPATIGASASETTPPKTGGDEASEEEEQRTRAREIEREASEHLARRASEMSFHSSTPEPTSRRKTKDANLPSTPPPPAPPRKDSLPAAKQKGKEAEEEEFDEKQAAPEDIRPEVPEAPKGTAEVAGTEIQNIIDQFQEGMGLDENEIMSPVLGRQQPVLVLPPRSSSLSLRQTTSHESQEANEVVASPMSPQSTGNASITGRSRAVSEDEQSIKSVTAGSIFQPPPPSPDPEPALPFDFHRFLEQLRHRTADPVARFLRSFLNEFGKKQWMVHEQVKIISDFLEFITKKMGQCEVWRTVSDAEFDNAREGMEKLVMNRLYSQTFSPALPPLVGSPRKQARSGRQQADQVTPHGPGRRGQHQEDVERDEVIAQKIRIYGWIEEEHLDIKPVGDKGKKFLTLAQQELLKINAYRAPRDKVICVLNCCKVIFGFLKNSKADQSADAFVPLLIYTVLKARPEHLVSNVQYIWRFRNQDKMGGEAGYYMSSLLGVVTFIENLDRTNLTITDQEFEAKVEQAVSAIAEKDRAEEYEGRSHAATSSSSEKDIFSGRSTVRSSNNPDRSSPRRSANRSQSEKVAVSRQADDDDGDVDAVTGLLRSIQKPLSSIGRMFSDESASQTSGLKPGSATSSKPTSRNLSPAPQLGRRPSVEERLARRPSADPLRMQQDMAAVEARVQQASIEGAQAQKIRNQEHKVVVETLQSMFPNLDKDVIGDVVRSQEGNVGKAVDACLALSG